MADRVQLGDFYVPRGPVALILDRDVTPPEPTDEKTGIFVFEYFFRVQSLGDIAILAERLAGGDR